MEYINCPICGKNETEIIYKKGNLDKDLINVICEKCSLVYINPRPPKEEYEKFLKEDFLSDKNLTNVGQLKNKLHGSDEKIKKTIIDFLNPYLKDGQSILEVGCGAGTLLHLLKEKYNVEATGIDPNELDINAAKKYYNLDLFQGSLDDFYRQNSGAQFDIIVIHHTFEHLLEPQKALEQIKQLLKPKGILYIGVPNIMNIKKRPDIFFQIAHPFSYSPRSLSSMLNQAGFGIVKLNENAGYPGGMETIARIGENAIEIKKQDYSEVISHVQKVDKKFGLLRKARKSLFFFLPRATRVNLGRSLYLFLKGKKNKPASASYKKSRLIVGLFAAAIISAVIFNLSDFVIFWKIKQAGLQYTYLSFVNGDAYFLTAPILREPLDGNWFGSDGLTYEHIGCPLLRPFFSTWLSAPLILLTKSTDLAYLIGRSIVAALTFFVFYKLLRLFIENKIFCALSSIIFVVGGYLFNFSFPSSLGNIKVVIRSFLPFGSPPVEIMPGQFNSLATFPGLFCLPLALWSIGKFLFNQEKKYYIIIAGILTGLLSYNYSTSTLYVWTILGIIGLFSLCHKDYDAVKKIGIVFLISITVSYWYFVNQFSISALPWASDAYKRLGVIMSHNFLWSRWPDYLFFIIFFILVWYFSKNREDSRKRFFLSALLLAPIIDLNLQTLTGFNPHPTGWFVRQFYVGFSIVWIIVMFYVYKLAIGRIRRKNLIKFIFVLLFLSLSGRIIYANTVKASNEYKHHYIPKNIYESLLWLDANTPSNSVVVSPYMATNVVVANFTHNRIIFTGGTNSTMSQWEILDRLYVSYKLFGVPASYMQTALEKKLPRLDNFVISGDNNLPSALFYYFYDDEFSPTIFSSARKEIPGAALQKIINDYEKYPNKIDFLLGRYKIDYVYFGPYEKMFAKADFDKNKLMNKVYDKDGIKVYKIVKTN